MYIKIKGRKVFQNNDTALILSEFVIFCDIIYKYAMQNQLLNKMWTSMKTTSKLKE